MRNNWSKNVLFVTSILALIFQLNCYAEDATDKSYIAKVNGMKVSSTLFENLLSAQISQGNKDTPELRTSIINELIVREVLSQAAKKEDIDKDKSVQDLIFLENEKILAEAYLGTKINPKEITEAEITIEYEKQKNALLDVDEYEVSYASFASEKRAQEFVNSIKIATSLDKSIKEISPTKEKPVSAGEGWFLSSQLISPISSVIANMNVGQISKQAIQTQNGWQIVQLVNKRKYKVPTLDESKAKIISIISMQKRLDFINNLVKLSKIEK